MKIFREFSFLMLICMSGVSHAQDSLDVNGAIAIALEQNYDIRIARNDAEIARIGNNWGNAGFLPSLTANFNRDEEIIDTRQQFFTGEVREGENVKNNFLNGNVVLDWTIFGGMAALTTRDQLMAFEDIGRVGAQVQVENAVSQVIAAYYDLVQKQKQKKAIENAIEISLERKILAEERLRIGSGSGQEVLLASVDINADSAALIRLEYEIVDGKAVLNQLMGREPDTEFEVVTRIEIREDLIFADLSQKVMAQNRELTLARTDVQLAELGLKTSRSTMFPTLGVIADYRYQRSESEIGFLQSNQTSGLTYGVVARWTIFDGLQNRTANQIAKITIENSQQSLEQAELRLRSELYRYYTAYVTVSRLYGLEQKNVEVARENLDISTEMMRIGTITALQLREAQRSLIDAEFRLIQTSYELKISETELLRLSGDLLRSF